LASKEYLLAKFVSEKDRASIEKKLEEMFASARSQENLDTEKMLQDVMNALYRTNIRYDWKFTFGIIKGLMLISGERYVSSDDFKNLMQKYIMNLYIKKLPALGLNWLGTKVQDVSDKQKEDSTAKQVRSSIMCKNLLQAR